MYTRCIRCRRSLDKNVELPHLSVGRRIAYDAAKGRVWVVCTHCDQWNLVPIEERWEVLDECEHLARTAEVRGPGDHLAIARTSAGLELLRVGGMSDVDIANWRYGRPLVKRQRLLLWIALALGGLAAALGLRAGVEVESAWFGVYVATCVAGWFALLWRNPPHIRPILLRLRQRRLLIWPWELGDIRIERARDDAHTLILLPGRRRPALSCDEAAEFLASILPLLNGAECATASVRRAVAEVTAAERETRSAEHAMVRKKKFNEAILRPWERIACDDVETSLLRMAPQTRLALEIAATEDVEQLELARAAALAEPTWKEQELIAGIADDLLVPEPIRARLESNRRAKDG